MRAQAWGWLMAGVLAAGMNAWYHDGGFAVVHRVAERVDHGTAALMALASGRADEFLAQARMFTAADDTSRARWTEQLARVQAMSDRQQAQFNRFQADRDRMEATMEAQAARMQIAAVTVDALKVRCPRISVRVPQVRTIRVRQFAPFPAASPITVHTFDGGPI